MLGGCGGGSDDPPSPEADTPVEVSEPHCDDRDVRATRRDLFDRVGAPPLEPGIPAPRWGEKLVGEGWTATAVGWDHPSVEGDSVYGVVHLPEPLPTSPAPLLINVHGHWDGGLAADEPARRAQLFASRGWVVFSIANRGDEVAGDPGARAVHLTAGIYGEMRVRRTGTTPLAWDLRAGQSALAMALAGRLGPSIDADAVAVIGFSGGAERAALLATSDPRVGAVVLGSHEYAFSTQRGTAGCSCGALRGAGESAGRPGHFPDVGDAPTAAPKGGAPRAWHWLAAAACRPGSPATDRPVLLWDHRPGDAVDALLKARPGVTVKTPTGTHGVTSAVAAESWGWLEATLRGGAVSASTIDEARAAIDASYPGPGTPRAEEIARPAPGSVLHRGGPAAQRTPTPIAAARAVLGVGRPGLVRGAFQGHATAPATTEGPAKPDWIRFAPPAPTGEVEAGEVIYARPELAAAAAGGVRDLIVPFAADAESDRVASRWGAERGIPAMAYLVTQLLEAREGATSRLGWIGVGAGGVAVAWAAAVSGGSGPVVLVDAPVTLWVRGPVDADLTPGVPWLPWPAWTLAPVPSGMALDPWQAGRFLDDRVRWVRPRGGDGSLWKGPLPGGSRYESVAEATRW